MALAVLMFELRSRGQNYSAVQPQEAIRLMNQGAQVLDLRNKDAFAAGHVSGAKHLDPGKIDSAGETLKKLKERTLLLVCEDGHAGRQTHPPAACRRIHEGLQPARRPCGLARRRPAAAAWLSDGRRPADASCMRPTGAPTARGRARLFESKGVAFDRDRHRRGRKVRAPRCASAAVAPRCHRFSSTTATLAATTTRRPWTTRASWIPCLPGWRAPELLHSKPRISHGRREQRQRGDRDEHRPNLALQGVYLKDCSYEAPQGPRADGNWAAADQPRPRDHQQRHPGRPARSGADGHGVRQAERQDAVPRRGEAGRRVPDAEPRPRTTAKRAIASICPGVLFPYARSMVSQLVSQGGFPQLLLPPVNFDALYLNAQAQSRPTRTTPARTDGNLAPSNAAHAHCRARQRFLGHGARHPVRARRQADAHLGPRCRAAGADARASAATGATCLTRHFRRPARGRHVARCRARGRQRRADRRAEQRLSRASSRISRRACRAGMRVAWATKGFERDTGLLPHQVAHEVLGDNYAVAVLSGPTFAKEVGAGLPTAMVVASPDADFATRIAEDLASPTFRTYISTDIMGVEIGGAVKNVIAIGAGTVRRPGLRREHARRADHARPERDDAARRRARRARARPSWASPASATWCSPAPTTSRATAASAWRWRAAGTPEAAMQADRPGGRGLSRRRASCARWRAATALDLPICEGICRMLFDGADAAEVVRELMRRPPGRSSSSKAVLPPGLVDDDGHGIGQVEAAVARLHGDAQPLVIRRQLRRSRRPAGPRSPVRTAGCRRAETGPRRRLDRRRFRSRTVASALWRPGRSAGPCATRTLARSW